MRCGSEISREQGRTLPSRRIVYEYHQTGDFGSLVRHPTGIRRRSRRRADVILQREIFNVTFAVHSIRHKYSRTMSSLDDQTQIWGQSSSVSSPSSLLAGIRSGHTIHRLSGMLEHFPIVIRSTLVLDLFSQSLDLVTGMRNTN